MQLQLRYGHLQGRCGRLEHFFFEKENFIDLDQLLMRYSFVPKINDY